MAQYTTIKNGQKYRLYGNYNNHSKNGRPMIVISLQIVGKGTRELIIVGFDCWNKAVTLLKENNIATHDDFEKILMTEFKGF